MARAEIRRILFIRTDRLGETLLNLPAVVALKTALPQAEVSFLAQRDLVPLLRGVPEITDVLASAQGPRGLWWARALAVAAQLRARRFDAAIVSNPKQELHAAVWLAGIPVRVGYGRKWGGLLTHRLPDRKALGERHEVEYNLDLVRALGLSAVDGRWPSFRFEREQAELVQLLEQQGVRPAEPFIAVHPWTSNPRKQWPFERYRELIRRLGGQHKPRVTVIGAAQQRQAVDAILGSGAGVVDLVGRVTLRQLAALLQRARLLISNDSGPAHLAAAVGTRTVVLFGTSDPSTGPGRWGPWGKGHLVIAQPSMDAITVEQVLDAVGCQLQ